MWRKSATLPRHLVRLVLLVLLAAVAVAVTLVAQASRVAAAAAPLKLIIDTDGVADDVRALSIALQHPRVQVLAVTTVAGSTSVSSRPPLGRWSERP